MDLPWGLSDIRIGWDVFRMHRNEILALKSCPFHTSGTVALSESLHFTDRFFFPIFIIFNCNLCVFTTLTSLILAILSLLSSIWSSLSFIRYPPSSSLILYLKAYAFSLYPRLHPLLNLLNDHPFYQRKNEDRDNIFILIHHFFLSLTYSYLINTYFCPIYSYLLKNDKGNLSFDTLKNILYSYPIKKVSLFLSSYYSDYSLTYPYLSH